MYTVRYCTIGSSRVWNSSIQGASHVHSAGAPPSGTERRSAVAPDGCCNPSSRMETSVSRLFVILSRVLSICRNPLSLSRSVAMCARLRSELLGGQKPATCSEGRGRALHDISPVFATGAQSRQRHCICSPHKRRPVHSTAGCVYAAGRCPAQQRRAAPWGRREEEP